MVEVSKFVLQCLAGDGFSGLNFPHGKHNPKGKPDIAL